MTAIGPWSVGLKAKLIAIFRLRKVQKMTLETSLIDSGLRNWRSNVDRAGNLFGNLPQEQLLQEVAPGKNRLIYLWGHLTAFNDALIPLLGFGPRIHPELDLMFVSNPDRTVPTILLGEDLKIIWQQTRTHLINASTKSETRRVEAFQESSRHGAYNGQQACGNSVTRQRTF